ncbi:hypothetical protein D3C72_264070 [compost metagenome]
MNLPHSIKKSSKKFWQKWSIAIRISPFIVLIGILKTLSHDYGLEVIELNALFTSLVAGTIFLIGFLISGVLSGYKESEKLPSELSASMKSLFDDTYTIFKSKDTQTAAEFLEYQKTFCNSLIDWFYKKEKTESILKSLLIGFTKKRKRNQY